MAPHLDELDTLFAQVAAEFQQVQADQAELQQKLLDAQHDLHDAQHDLHGGMNKGREQKLLDAQPSDLHDGMVNSGMNKGKEHKLLDATQLLVDGEVIKGGNVVVATVGAVSVAEEEREQGEDAEKHTHDDKRGEHQEQQPSMSPTELPMLDVAAVEGSDTSTSPPHPPPCVAVESPPTAAGGSAETSPSSLLQVVYIL